MALPAHRLHEMQYLVNHSEAVALATPAVHRGFDHADLAQTLLDQSPTLVRALVQGTEVPRRPGFASLDDLCAPASSGELSVELPHPDPSSVALFLLSGGTTGLPKLIPRTHDDYVCNVIETSRHAAIDDANVYLGTLPLGHNFTLACPGWLGALFAGGTVVILASPETRKAFAAISTYGVTHAAAVPAVAQSWLEHAQEVGNSQLTTLRVLQVGGARIADEMAARIEPVLGARLQQVFGMAEGLINVTHLDDPLEAIIHSQGRPVCQGDEIRLVDEETGKPVAFGNPGVLLTRGPYTPRSYYNAPEANSRSFTDDAWYISGDIVRIRPDGNLVVEGRSKDMINRGGESISAEEIENLIYRLERVRLAAAVAMEDERLGEQICVFVVHDDLVALVLEEIHQAFDAWGVAGYKRPERLVRLAELPMTKVGKIDKKALREWLEVHPAVSA
jgi:2,3-dihydroxybenzoate-AMP ligase